MSRTGNEEPTGSKRVVITGVTRGLGRALAVGIAAAGHSVVGCGRDLDELDSLRQTLSQIGSAPGIQHDLREVDLATDSAARWAAAVVAAGAPDLLIANAGVIHRSAPLWELSVDESRRVVDINLGGVLRTLHGFLPSMVARGEGVVALLSSGWGRSVSPEVSVYCATKWAIEGLARALALELPSGMAAVAVNPGIIDTAMLRSAFGAEAAAHPDPQAWAERAVPFFLGLDASDNGGALTV